MKTKILIVLFFWPTKLFKGLQKGMLVPNLKEINQNLLPVECIYTHTYICTVLKKRSKCVLRTRIRVHFMVLGLGLTIMVI